MMRTSAINELKRARGTILVVVMVLIALLAMLAVSVMFRMRGESAAATANADRETAYSTAMSGIGDVFALIKSNPQDMITLFDNPDEFEAHLVTDDGRNQWYFTVWAYDVDVPDVIRYGVIDEAGKLNLNNMTVQGSVWVQQLPVMMSRLPRMDIDLGMAAADYIDSDSTTRANGAEQDYYDLLDRPYVIRNGALTTVEELLLVKGFNGQILYGEDANFNGLLDPNEDDGDERFPPDNGDGILDRGLVDYVTVFSQDDQSQSADGLPKTNVNTADQAMLEDSLSDQVVTYIMAKRQQPNPADRQIEYVWDLLEAPPLTTGGGPGGPGGPAGPGGPGGQGQQIESGVDGEQLKALLERFTGSGGAEPVGRVNVNTAPEAVLMAVLDGDEELARRIVDTRRSLDSTEKNTFAWLYTDGLMEADMFKRVAPLLTSVSQRYRIRVVGYGLPSGRFCILEAVIDTSGNSPRILYLRDISKLGLPFAIETEE